MKKLLLFGVITLFFSCQGQKQGKEQKIAEVKKQQFYDNAPLSSIVEKFEKGKMDYRELTNEQVIGLEEKILKELSDEGGTGDIKNYCFAYEVVRTFHVGNDFDAQTRKEMLQEVNNAFRKYFFWRLSMQKNSGEILNLISSARKRFALADNTGWGNAPEYEVALDDMGKEIAVGYYDLAIKEARNAKRIEDLPMYSGSLIYVDGPSVDSIIEISSKFFSKRIKSARSLSALEGVYSDWLNALYHETDINPYKLITDGDDYDGYYCLDDRLEKKFEVETEWIVVRMLDNPGRYSFDDLFAIYDTFLPLYDMQLDDDYLVLLIKKAKSYEDCERLIDILEDKPILKDAAMKKAQRILGLGCS